MTRSSPPAGKRSALTLHLDAVPVAAIACQNRLTTAWGDGCLRHFVPGQPPSCLQVHAGAILALAADSGDGDAVLSGGDDGMFARVDTLGAQVLARFPGQWVEHVDAAVDGSRACAVARRVHLWEPDGRVHVLEHPSSVGGIAFDPAGHHLAVAHYGGITLWTRASDGWHASQLACRGSHLAVTWSPDGRFVLSSMQEGAMHGWRVADQLQIHIAGYARKVRQWCWLGDASWLASGGSNAAILWPFDTADGPMQRSPLTLFDDDAQALVGAVCALPAPPRILAGRSDGSVLLGDPLAPEQWYTLRQPGRAPVALLAVLPAPQWLLVAHTDGEVLWLPLQLP
ncbi:WD40 repeat domain-containing protein [Xanthomonas maliensis]|uniref:WD40 repeat domain-containing protein n=1 Tax=Xanthomonas maliensis TaxID=1321368 RepID=UPI0003B65BA9|nr:hypothetical protein [Xanthomonas maliensis]KAB7770856.1 hypothetical protein CKY51_03990 [Xanthomonas maliensis]